MVQMEKQILVKKASAVPPIQAKDGSTVREIWHPKNDPIGHHLSLAYNIVQPGQMTALHVLHQVEIYFVLQGKGTIRVGDEEVIVNKNESVYVHPGQKQCIENTGDTPFHYLVVVAPPFSRSEVELL